LLRCRGRRGIPLGSADAAGVYTCPESGLRYREKNGVLHCLDLDEESPLPEELERSTESYRELKRALQLG
jgi:UDP-2-acetamido-3-amino-2,3-dideoxy-glucuronate N-acetyltransferase